MSRIGKRPIPVPPKVTVTINGQAVTVKGPKGELNRVLPDGVYAEQEGDALHVKRRDDSRMARERHGLGRTLVANMVQGVSQGFERRLEIQGVGYRAQVQGRNLLMNMGYSHPVQTVSGINKEDVGNTSAKIRAVRPPEPYKGKGIRYAGEVVRRKAGKTGKK
jgi:large subunit ribosomal protein L6